MRIHAASIAGLKKDAIVEHAERLLSGRARVIDGDTIVVEGLVPLRNALGQMVLIDRAAG